MTLLSLLVAMTAMLALSGCGEDDRGDDNALERAAEDVGDAAGQAAQSIEYEAEEAGLATPDADDDTGPEDDL